MARKIVVTSGKGGVGKTTVCANLGVYLSRLGFRVCMLDVDIGLNNLDVVMGLEKQVIFDITDVVSGKCRVGRLLFKILTILHSIFCRLLIPMHQVRLLGNILKI